MQKKEGFLILKANMVYCTAMKYLCWNVEPYYVSYGLEFINKPLA